MSPCIGWDYIMYNIQLEVMTYDVGGNAVKNQHDPISFLEEEAIV